MPLKIYVPNSKPDGMGGGWTFLRNFVKAVSSRQDCELPIIPQHYEVMLIVGATMIERDEVRRAKTNGAKIVLRVDNLPRESRNRGTAFRRLREYAELADAIVYQSEWAKEYVGYFLPKDKKSLIIYNGVDPDYFYEDISNRKQDSYLYVQYNRDENKRWTESAMMFHQQHRKNRSSFLTIVGNFSDEIRRYQFDFVDGEQYEYIPPCDHRNLGAIMRRRQFLLFPAYGDAAPNTVLEALACGMEIVGVNNFGGTKEMLALKGRTIHDMAEQYIDLFRSL